MALFLDEPGGHVAPGAHAVVVLDGAGWHAVKELRRPANVTPLPLPAYSPELNPQERVWALLRQRYLALCAASSITPPCSTPARMRGAGSSASRGASARSAPPPGPPSHDFSGGV